MFNNNEHRYKVPEPTKVGLSVAGNFLRNWRTLPFSIHGDTRQSLEWLPLQQWIPYNGSILGWCSCLQIKPSRMKSLNSNDVQYLIRKENEDQTFNGFSSSVETTLGILIATILSRSRPFHTSPNFPQATASFPNGCTPSRIRLCGNRRDVEDSPRSASRKGFCRLRPRSGRSSNCQ